MLYAGIVTENACAENKNRFLVFFDDGFAQYLPVKKLHHVYHTGRGQQSHIHYAIQGCALEAPGSPCHQTFCSWATRNSCIFHRNHNAGCPGSTGLPSIFSWSSALLLIVSWRRGRVPNEVFVVLGVESSVNPLEVLSIQDGGLGEGLHVWMHAKILILRNTFQYYNYCNCLSPWDVASFIKQRKKETLFYLLWCNEWHLPPVTVKCTFCGLIQSVGSQLSWQNLACMSALFH